MKAIIFPLAFLAAAVSAQSTACAANYVVEACLGTTNGQFAECGTNDYGCQCAAYTEMLVYVTPFPLPPSPPLHVPFCVPCTLLSPFQNPR